MINQEEKQKLVEKLNERFRNGGLSCPMCHHRQFTVADGYTNNILQDNFNGLVIGGPSIPAIPIICTNCGFISMHAIGVLGLLPSNEKKQEDGKGGNDNG